MRNLKFLAIIVAIIAITGGAFLLGRGLDKQETQTPPPAVIPTSPTPKPSPTPTPIPAPSPTPSPVTGKEPIGFIGCSNSRDAVQGYWTVGGKRIWFPNPNAVYGGGTPLTWANDLKNPTQSVKYWASFDRMNKENPGAKTIWLSLCLRATESDVDSYNSAVTIINEAKKRIPGATIYVSALNGFVAPHACAITGKNGPQRAQTLADRLVSEGRAKTGPDVGDLISDDQIPSAGATAQNTETVSDGCHPTTDVGEPKLGRELLKFFPN